MENYRKKKWQVWKMNKPNIKGDLRSILIGMIISDATVLKNGKYAYIKIEQGVKQEEFVKHLLYCLKDYCFEQTYNIRYDKGKIKSFYFKTFTHPTFLTFYNLFYKDSKKVIPKAFILNNVDSISLAYWIMGDGSFNQRDQVLYLHTEGFSYNEILNISEELNLKFNLNSKVYKDIRKGKIFYKIYIPKRDMKIIKDLVEDKIIPMFKYKLSK